MKKAAFIFLLIVFATGLVAVDALAQGKNLRLIFIRHAEKPDDGDNLSCMGLNRAMKLPEVLKAKFGVPSYVYVPALHLGKSTPRGRMFQTVSPFAIKYNLTVNSSFEEENAAGLAVELTAKKGTILIVWEHSQIKPILKALGLNVKNLQWPNDDFDTIWIVGYKKGKPFLTVDKEGITPMANCNF
ncbi:histidine phosphatase family protein [Mucilaginibacter sabulilitoris]|uniref:Histidine phosphatase family protein n=1 Tax=Mucilaginibacter sabulilitoris TaxID=1173583 RepID=A0ABZ0TMR5_9SPHI|nr:histidine phosphatase family protein [Mucilaginibacter sabulilitoris]WPU93473.1 histidine phosphatase family protein [Mucilaginibacter sabulilitoris]